MTADNRTGQPGRPRDPDVDRRVLVAALDQFGAEGWHSFSIEAVARRAKVGKASIYRRWSDKEDVLVEALEAHMLRIRLLDSDASDDLRTLATALVDRYAGLACAAVIRLQIEGDLSPRLMQWRDLLTQDVVAAVRKLVKRRQQHGTLRPGISTARVAECLAGAVLIRALTLRYTSAVPGSRSTDEFVDELVDLLTVAIESP